MNLVLQLIRTYQIKTTYHIIAEVVFEYTGKGCAVPKDVTSARFHPSVVKVEKMRHLKTANNCWR